MTYLRIIATVPNATPAEFATLLRQYAAIAESVPTQSIPQVQNLTDGVNVFWNGNIIGRIQYIEHE